MGEIVKIKKSSKKSESSKFWGKNQKIFVHPRTVLRTPRLLYFFINKEVATKFVHSFKTTTKLLYSRV